MKLFVPSTQLEPVRADLELGGYVWHVKSMFVQEGLGIPFQVDLQVTTTHDIWPYNLLDQPATFAFGRAELRELKGFVSYVVDQGIDDDVHRLQLRIHHEIHRLRYENDSQVFLHRNVPDVVQQVLKCKTDVRKKYLERDYCVQYQETNFDFAHRLMEEEGLTYRITDDAVLLCDALGIYGVPHEPVTVGKEDLEKELLTELHQSFATRTEGHQVSAFNWRNPDARDVSVERRFFVHDNQRQIVDTGDNHTFEEPQSDRRAELLDQAEGYAASTWHGKGNVTTLEPGSFFEFGDDIKITVTDITHFASFPVDRQNDEVPTYENNFTATAVPFLRKYNIKRPTIYGPQTALVVGPENEEIHTDLHGRIKVRFHWERYTETDGSEGWWVRVSSGWAGAGFGMITIPRIGMEVVVSFENGNPDCPLVTGCVYNSKTLSPYELPVNKTKSTWRSESSPGGNGFNELRFEDAAGDEEVFIHAQKTMTEVVKGSRSLSVGGGRSASIGGDDSRTVSGAQTLTVKKDRTKTITGNETVKVDGNRGVELGSDDTLMTTGKTSVVLQGGLETTVTGNEKRTVSDLHELSVTGEHKVTVTGKSSLNVTDTHDATAMTRYAMAQAMVGKVVLEAGAVAAWGNTSCTMSSGPNAAPTAVVKCEGGMVMIEAATEIRFKCGDTLVTLAADGTISINGSKIDLVAAESSIALSGSGVEVTGPEIKSAASGNHEITGATVKIN